MSGQFFRYLHISYSVSYFISRIIISHTPYHHTSYSVSSYLRIFISHTPYHHISYIVSYLILYIIISHTPYHHISYSVSSYLILRIIISHTPYLTIIPLRCSYSTHSFHRCCLSHAAGVVGVGIESISGTKTHISVLLTVSVRIFISHLYLASLSRIFISHLYLASLSHNPYSFVCSVFLSYPHPVSFSSFVSRMDLLLYGFCMRKMRGSHACSWDKDPQQGRIAALGDPSSYTKPQILPYRAPHLFSSQADRGSQKLRYTTHLRMVK